MKRIGVSGATLLLALVVALVSAISVGAAPAKKGTRTFVNDNAIFIPSDRISGGTGGKAGPYPSGIRVAGFKKVTDVNVTFRSTNHTDPDDVDVLLVGPTGRTAILMSDAGGDNDIIQAGQPGNGQITLDDEARTFLPDSGRILTPRAYMTSNYQFGETWPAPAPAQGGNRLLSTFNGTNPGGLWRLYVNDDTVQPDTGDRNGTGVMANGWAIRIQGLCSNQNSNNGCVPRR